MISMAGAKLAGIALLACSLSACDILSECENTVIARATNPAGDRTAIAFARSCGATTSDTLQISIGEGESFSTDDKGNVVIVENPAREIRQNDMTWTSDRVLEVSLPEGEETFLKLDQFDAVQIVYR